MWFWELYIPFRECLMPSPVRKLPDFLLTYTDVRTVKCFPPAKSWLVNSNFRRASRMQEWCRHMLDRVPSICNTQYTSNFNLYNKISYANLSAFTQKVIRGGTGSKRTECLSSSQKPEKMSHAYGCADSVSCYDTFSLQTIGTICILNVFWRSGHLDWKLGKPSSGEHCFACEKGN